MLGRSASDHVPTARAGSLGYASNGLTAGPGRRFAFLVEEAVLRYRLGHAEVMAAQLGQLRSLAVYGASARALIVGAIEALR